MAFAGISSDFGFFSSLSQDMEVTHLIFNAVFDSDSLDGALLFYSYRLIGVPAL